MRHITNTNKNVTVSCHMKSSGLQTSNLVRGLSLFGKFDIYSSD